MHKRHVGIEPQLAIQRLDPGAGRGAVLAVIRSARRLPAKVIAAIDCRPGDVNKARMPAMTPAKADDNGQSARHAGDGKHLIALVLAAIGGPHNAPG